MMILRCARVFLSLCLSALLSPAMSSAYDLDTHEAIARDAFVQARIADRLPSYGLDPMKRIRDRDLGLRLSRRSSEAWVVRGARDEDFPDIRVVNHFYDPYYDRGLTTPVASGQRAPDWALEDLVQYAYQNHSYRDAREAFHGGLTLPEPQSREGELGHTLYALGHVIHLIQDVTVPEHARNDVHFFIGPGRSLAESYLQRNVDVFFPIPVKLSQAAMPVIGLPRELWANPAGTGLAQFTNANFVSPDTNFTQLQTGATSAEYPSPVLDLTRVETGPIGRCKGATWGTLPLPDSMVFFGNVMPDPVGATLLVNQRMTTYSILDEDLRNRMKGLVFSINCFTIDAAAELLLPRAASYSASLLKYFFRGRPTAIFGGGALRIVNRTSDVQRAEGMTGQFELYRDDAMGRRQLLAGWNLSLLPEWMSGPLPVPLLPDGDTSRCILVFRGQIGEEVGGVAGQQLDRCPTAATLAGPYVEVGLNIGSGPSSGGSPGCTPSGFFAYLLEICCDPGGFPPHYGSFCAPDVQGAITACQSKNAFFYVCRLPS
jgi:hypothetical protein